MLSSDKGSRRIRFTCREMTCRFQLEMLWTAFFTFSPASRENRLHVFGKGCNDSGESSRDTGFHCDNNNLLFELESPKNLSFHSRKLLNSNLTGSLYLLLGGHHHVLGAQQEPLGKEAELLFLWFPLNQTTNSDIQQTRNGKKLLLPDTRFLRKTHS